MTLEVIMKTITQAELKQHLHYDPTTGVFTRLKHFHTTRIGKPAGGYNSKGYLVIKINYVDYYAHRLAFVYMYGYMPKEIDHIDRDKGNNRIKNLREVTRQDNILNKDGYLEEDRGIWYNDKRKHYQVYAQGKIFAGTSRTIEGARQLRRVKENSLF